ncbi:hypothetical protein [Psychroserpens algicola]|uniref:hypothetical protein n=1 Tax=Psychroserpens algicola TaxID=1719034 RepID=UPI001953388E|nr:hypothetical protein [Psychroserpens algicola]
MKRLLLPFLFIAFSVNAQQKEIVDLKWKISDTLTYKTVMKDIMVPQEESKSEKQTDTLFGGKANDFFKKMQEQTANLKYETKLYPDKNGNIDIAMFLKADKTDTTETLFSGMAKMNGNVVLRGKVSTEGELLSFYYKSSQTNLIAILFELPKEPIKVGDEWSLKVDLISMDQNFVADTLYRKNKVRLEKIIEQNGDKIAVIKYDIEEYVSGDFGNGLMTMFAGESDKETYMKISHKATGLFSLNKGFWFEYDGIMEVDTNLSMMGMGGKKRTEFKLTPEK